MIGRESLSELMSFSPDHYLTTTLYLRIESGPQNSHVIELKDLLKSRKKDLENQTLPPEVRKSVNSDLRKIKDYVNLKFSREGVKTLIIFSSTARKLWKVLTLSLPVTSQLVVTQRPYLRPLTLVLDEYSRFLAILIERQRARLFEIHAGEIIEYDEVLDEVPSRVRVGGYGGYEEKRIHRHIEDHVRRHFKHVAEIAFDLFKKNAHDHVVLFGTEHNTNEFHHYLHNTLHDKIVATETEDINASSATILEHVMRIERRMKQQQDKKLLERLFNQVNSGGLAIVGLDSTIRALQQGQVNFLVVQEGYEKDGYRCLDCRSLLTNNGSCDYCGGRTQNVQDIVEEAVQDALQQGCHVKYISLPDSPLSMAGKIGAMLRFKT